MKKDPIDREKKFGRLAIESAIIRSLSSLSTTINLIATPVIFIHYSNIYNLGLWTLVLSVGSFAAILDLGLIQVMTTASIQAFAKNKSEIGRSILNDLLNYLIYLVVGILILLLILQSNFGSIWTLSQNNVSQLVALCFFNYSLGILVRYYEGAFRALGKLFGLKLLVLSSYADLTILLSNVILGVSFTLILLEMIGMKIILVAILSSKFQRNSSIFKLKRPMSAFLGILPYLKLGISFLGMPLGYLVLNEISNIVVASILGLEMLGIFTILKSLSGIFRQVSGICILSMTPRFTELISMEKFEIAQMVFLRMKNFLIVLNGLVLMFLLSTFSFLTRHISKLESVGYETFVVFLALAFLNIWWIIESTVIVSVNQHKGLTLRFLYSSVASCLIGCALLFQFGVSAMAIGTLVNVFILIPYSIKLRKRILKSTPIS
jgi:O-antigen/teichoic acid export membrane protein